MLEIIKTERETLISKPEAEELQAGVDRFARFGVLNRIDSLAGGDITKYDEVMMQPYSVVFAKLQMNLEQSQYSKRLRRVWEEKRK